MVDLQHIVNELDLWKEGKGVILKGSGQNFCSGGDLDFARSTGTADEGFMMATFMHNILTKFQQLPLISVALVEGVGLCVKIYSFQFVDALLIFFKYFRGPWRWCRTQCGL